LNRTYFQKQLLSWYDVNKRDLPWRKTRDAYQIWLSEIILQQTRIMQGYPYYLKFIDKYQDIYALANASEKDILRTWQGLGYYSRARNMHKCAKNIIKNWKGAFPDSYQELIKLPGIGPYTAAAIASIAFGKTVAVVDGNVYRVLSRVFGISEDISSVKGKKIFHGLASEMMPESNTGEYNQAIMEFGALHCTPVKPKCEECPLRSRCYAFINNNQQYLPFKLKKNKIKIRHFHYLVIKQNSSIFMNRRSSNDIWFGLYDFLLLESKNEKIHFANYDLTKILFIYLKNAEIRVYRHLLTHQVIHATFYTISIKKNLKELYGKLPENGKFYSYEEIESLPKPVLIEKYLKEE